MLNQCIIQGIVELGVANLKKKINISCQASKSDRQMGRKHKFDFSKKKSWVWKHPALPVIAKM